MINKTDAFYMNSCRIGRVLMFRTGAWAVRQYNKHIAKCKVCAAAIKGLDKVTK